MRNIKTRDSKMDSGKKKENVYRYARMSGKDICKMLKTNQNKGLSQKEAEKRLKKYGKNIITARYRKPFFKILVSQFLSPLVLVLIFAGMVSYFLLNAVSDTILIFTIVLFNGIIGFFQEYKAEKTISLLMQRLSPKALVMRNGTITEIPGEQIVPGDVIILRPGRKVPADARLLSSEYLTVDESMLTGESMPVTKEIKPIEARFIGDLKNTVFAGTVVVSGSGKGIVIGTGSSTQLGGIAHLVAQTERQIPLIKHISDLAKLLTFITTGIIGLVFVLGLLQGRGLIEMFETAVGLGVAAIPEGLPAAVTIALALGIKRMEKKRVVVRHLASVETLGRTNVICVDKTGTLTKNEMTVQKVLIGNKLLTVTGVGYNTKGDVEDKEHVDANTLRLYGRACMLCNDSGFDPVNRTFYGDPTEIALKVLGFKLFPQGTEEIMQTRTATLEFDPSRKMMSTVHRTKLGFVQYTKGAPDVIIKRSKWILVNGKRMPMTKARRETVWQRFRSMSSHALRVIALAYRDASNSNDIKERDLTFLGLAGMFDPPRKGVKEAIKMAEEAGIQVKMITGDYKDTAIAIGRLIGITGRAVDGEQLDRMDDKELEKVIDEINIFARVSPEHKLRIVELLEKRYTVAMTGDGINDAPALKKASMGIAVPNATDVAKEASDLMLLNDHFRNILVAVEEGRRIYDNIKKFVLYLLSCNIAEIMIIFFGMLAGWDMPLTMIQLLWINIITDGPPAIALSIDPASPNILKRPPIKKGEPILNKRMKVKIFTVSLAMTFVSLALFCMHLNDVLLGRSMVFTMLILLEVMRVQAVRKDYGLSFWSNKKLLLALFVGVSLQIILLYTPLAGLFGVKPLEPIHWGILIISCALVYAITHVADTLINKRYTDYQFTFRTCKFKPVDCRHKQTDNKRQ